MTFLPSQILRSFATPPILKLLLLIWAFVTSLGCIQANSSPPPVIATICQQAKQDQKLVILIFINYQSLVSKNLEEKVLPTARVQEVIAEHFRSQRIEPSPTTADLVKHYAIIKYPTVLILRPDGTEIDRIVGYQEPEPFATRLKAIAEGRDELTSLRAATTAQKAGVESRIALATALMSRAQYASAFQELLWCLEFGASQDAQGYQRLYPQLFLKLTEMGTVIPEARKQLVTTRDQLESNIKPFDASWARITFTCNEALGESYRNLTLYDKLPKTSPLRLQTFSLVFLEMVGSRRYQEATSMTDLQALIQKSLAPSNTNTQGRFNTQAFQWSIAAMEAYLGVQEPEAAKKMALVALSLRNDKQTQSLIRQAARRALGDPKDQSFINQLSFSGNILKNN